MTDLNTLCDEIRVLNTQVEDAEEKILDQIMIYAELRLNIGRKLAAAQLLYTGPWKTDCQKLTGVSYQHNVQYQRLAIHADAYLTACKKEERLIGFRFLEQYKKPAKVWSRQQTKVPPLLGVVYALSNPAMPGLLKIGFTQNLPRRLFELSQETGVPMPFRLEWQYDTDQPAIVEATIHTALNEYRLNPGKEFFMISVAEFNEAVAELL